MTVPEMTSGEAFAAVERSVEVPADAEIVVVEVQEGESWAPLDPEKLYGVVANNFVRTGSEGFPEAAVTATPNSLYAGFGFEGIATPAERNEVMRRALGHLLD